MTPVSGETTIDEKMDFEVVALTLDAVRRIAGVIADRVKAKVGRIEPPAPVVLADESLVSRMAEWQVIAARIGAVEEGIEALLLPVEPPDAHEEGLVASLGQATSAVEAVAKLLSFFKAEARYSGRTVELPAAALYPALAGRLAEAGIEPVLVEAARPLGAGAATGRDLIGRLERLLRLREQLAAFLPDADEAGADRDGGDAKAGQAEGAEPNPDDPEREARQRGVTRITSLIGAVDAIMTDLGSGAEGGHRIAQIQAASAVTCLVQDAPAAYLLSAQIIKAGGHYRIRKHLFTTLFTGDQLYYGGGAAISFTLTDLKRLRVVLGDVLHHASGNVRAPWGSVGGRLSNLREPCTPSPLQPVAVPDEPLVTPNTGDDEKADPEQPGRFLAEGLRHAAWREAKALVTLRAQVNAMAPGRSKASDGTIGDAAHQSRDSDHNPWVIDDGTGVVTALDITNDPRHGCSADAIAEAIRRSRDPRVKYIIWNRRIASSTAIGRFPAWAWRRYTGDNPHTKHVHISVKADKVAYDSDRAWSL
ncbi:hypothetical protein [Methylobacterium nonmethylotrophicum]|uniref:Uncharacterized protein n=1 Tax=Methylobacterium nonmethylotrophicum TaxID=1141884 RepID=A0A4Z0NUZ5_9HYPH|nr:hypothetical protein [Methylobacterium nonmethylotrophicum]TGE00744.1 hypothetical protein EU555_08360 [Methylobacterium nonmethylotrophicum]